MAPSSRDQVWHQPCPTAGHVLSRSTTRVSSRPRAENPRKFTHRLEMCIRLSPPRSPRQQSCFLIWSLQINLSARHGPGLLTARLDLSNTPCTTLRHPLNDGSGAWCGLTRRAEGKFITLETLQTWPYFHAFLYNYRAKRRVVSVFLSQLFYPFMFCQRERKKKKQHSGRMLAVAAFQCPQVNYLEIWRATNSHYRRY